MRANRFFNLVVFASLVPILTFGQHVDSLSLFECYKLVRANAPELGLVNIHQQESELENQKLSGKNLPQVTAYGKAWYQSDAITVTIPFPGMEGLEIDRLQYNTGVNIDQKILDGGLNSILKHIKVLEGEIGQLETEVSLYKLNELVNTHFFGIIRLEKSVKILQLKSETLRERKAQVEAGVKNGIILEQELARIEAEIAATHQQVAEMVFGKAQLQNRLAVLAGKNGKQISWVLPKEIRISDSLVRIETMLYERNREYLESIKDIQGRKYVPQISAYGQAGYSYPGLNFFENKSDVYYIVGAKLSWKIFDWNEGKKEKQLIELHKNKVDIAEQSFNRNLEISIANQIEEIKMVEALISTDQKIISLKNKITKTSAASLDNGIITSADYLNDLNAELKARIDAEIHKIQLMEAKAKLVVIKGIHLQ